jgi:hypothetical protein
VTGPVSGALVDEYALVTGPGDFGPGSATNATSGSGDLVGMVGFFGYFFVPKGYISGNPLSDTATYSGQSFASLGVTPGTYVWQSYGSGGTERTRTSR